MGSLNPVKIITVAKTVLLSIAFLWLLVTWKTNAKLQYDLDREKLHTEALLAEKLLVEKSIVKTENLRRHAQDSLADLTTKNHRKDALISRQQNELNALKKKLYFITGQLQSAYHKQKVLEERLVLGKKLQEKLMQENHMLRDSIACCDTGNMHLIPILQKTPALRPGDHTAMLAFKKKNSCLTVKATKYTTGCNPCCIGYGSQLSDLLTLGWQWPPAKTYSDEACVESLELLLQ